MNKPFPTILDVAIHLGASDAVIQQILESEKRVKIEADFFEAIEGDDKDLMREKAKELIESLWNVNA